MPALPEQARSLSTRGLACRRGLRLLFSGLDFTLEPGQIVWLRGSNGRGKTSLLRQLAGLAHVEAGEITWGGQPQKAMRSAQAGATLYLAHANALKEDLTAAEALSFLAALHGQAAGRSAVLAALERLGIASRRDAPVRTLSQGQRRRVALARLALTPVKPLWLLDEPYDALDVDGCALIDGLLADHARGGGSVLLTSHLPLAINDPMPHELHLVAPAEGAS